MKTNWFNALEKIVGEVIDFVGALVFKTKSANQITEVDKAVPDIRDMRGTLKGRRVHAVVGRAPGRLIHSSGSVGTVFILSSTLGC